MPQTLPSGGFDIGDAPGSLLSSGARATLEVEVQHFDQLAPPDNPSEGDCCIVGVGATGPFYQWDNDIAVLVNGMWQRRLAQVGHAALHTTWGLWRRWNGRAWLDSDELGVSRGGLVASTTQTQGEGPLAHRICYVETCANANDARTLPAAGAGKRVFVVNSGAQTLQVFPAAGDSINAGAANASVTIAAGKARLFEGVDAGKWISMLGA